MSATHEICTSLEEFCGVLFTSDLGQARRNRDTADIAKLSQLFDEHPPFPQTTDIISIASGVVGDATITCYDAVRVGNEAMNKIVDLPFFDIKLFRKDRALSFSSVTSSIKIHDEKVAVDPTLLFQRMYISKRSEDDLIEFLEYELAPFPLALLNEGGMRKTIKSGLYSLLEHISKVFELCQMNIIVDGGFLLHRVIWQKGECVATICDGYIAYINRHYPGMSRTMAKLQENGIQTRQATDDADVLIVKTTVEQSIDSPVTVVGEDVDLAVLLIASTPPTQDILLLKPGRGKTKTIALSTQQKLGYEHILFLHSFTECDTISATFRRSKVGFSKLYLKVRYHQKRSSDLLQPRLHAQ
ncbi:unnamed protein product [Euphydryas editha]|uniref:Uncharacterized protein n=1 Tax=Euphydryas editha TaxID=104508 RepID=A0AAU9VAU6_EUPED|nr:unnamed protein product [Euphydryas editha]